jgi:hypothetical protein
MKKIIDDTLKSPNGKWSRKSLTSFFAFWLSIAYEGIYPIVGLETKEYVFSTLLLLVGATLGLTVWDKQTMYKNDKKEEDNEPIG